MGCGLMPDTLEAFMSQRYRWVYGAMQILKRHAGAIFGGGSRLTGSSAIISCRAGCPGSPTVWAWW